MLKVIAHLQDQNAGKGLRCVIASCLFASIITFFLVLGETSSFVAGFSFREALSLAPLQFVGAFALFYFAYVYLKEHRLVMVFNPIKMKYWIGSFAVLFVVWGINWLVFSPGYWTGDSVSSVRQALGEAPLNNQHPIIFTSLVAIFVNAGNVVGSLEAGMAAFTLFTMIVFSLCCSYFCSWMYARTNSFPIFIGTVLFFALNVVLAQYSITAWKDIYFSALLLIFVLKIVDLVCSKGEILISKKYLVTMLALSLLIMLFRSNGAFIVIFSFLALAVVYRSYWRKVAALASICLVLYLVVSGPLYSCFGVGEKAARETYGVPLQQIAKTIVDDGEISQENQAFLEKMFSFEEIKEAYDPSIVDPVKWADSFDDNYLKENQVQFIRVWLETFPKNISSYVAAWRDLTIGFWNPLVENWLLTYSGYEYFDGMAEWNSAKVDMDAYSVAPSGIEYISYSIEESYNLIMATGTERHLPILSLIYSIGSMVWLLLSVVILKIALRENKDILALMPLLLLWISLLIATPTFCEFRYILALHLAIPLVLLLLAYDIDSASDSIGKAHVEDK